MIPDSSSMIQKVCRTFILCSVVLMCLALGFVGYSNIRDRNSLAIPYRFHDDSRIYGLYPPDRVSKIYETGDRRQEAWRFQEIAASPVYLDIRYWQKFTKAKIEILYSKEPEVDFQIGYKIGKDFQWRLFPVTNEVLTNLAIARNVRQVVLEVDLTQEFVERNNVHRWIFSSSNVQDLEKAIRIYGIKFTFTK